MSRKIEEIMEILSSMLKKIEVIEARVIKQDETLKTYIEQGGLDSELGEILLKVYIPAKTSLELLRDEIEELHQIIGILFYEKK